MIQEVDLDKCTGCGICVDVCPLDVLRMDERGEKAIICYPDDCHTCFQCEMNCPPHAIYVHPFKEKLPLAIRYCERNENHG